jgi:hypothetical protein
VKVLALRALLVATFFISVAKSQQATDVPYVANENGHHALMVDGKPFLVLGTQINNSSSWPAVLPKVWPTLEQMHANTVEAPIYWEQMEPTQGKFDFSTVDLLLSGAREHHLHLILLWFGTWKNGNMHYAPVWVKTQPEKYLRVINANGEPLDVLSANSRINLEADKAAFSALMQHLAKVDGRQHTTLMIQVENESGIVGAQRDYSPASNLAFQGMVPHDLLGIAHKNPGTWQQVFGGHADETFQAYYQARYINEIAAAGKAEFKIPLYCNVWISYPIGQLPERQVPNPGIGYPSGGPVQTMLPLWKALTPSIDIIGPDIYTNDPQFVNSVIETYDRQDNPLWIPESGHEEGYPPFLFLALGHGGIGFSPFGADSTGGLLQSESKETPLPFAATFALLEPMEREIAALNFEGKIKTAVEVEGDPTQELDFGSWNAEIRFGHASDGSRVSGNKDHGGSALVAQLGPDEFLVTGIETSVRFHLPSRLPGLRMQILSAEEGVYVDGVWKSIRLLNGDQTDRGLNFGPHPESAVRVRLGRF